MGASSSTALRTGILILKPGMDLGQSGMQSLSHFRERRHQSGPPPNQHVIVAGSHCAACSRKPHHFAQPPANPVALDGAAYLPRHGVANAHGPMISSTTRLQDEGGACGLRPAGSGPKITPAS
jgi:hypothetical protein